MVVSGRHNEDGGCMETSPNSICAWRHSTPHVTRLPVLRQNSTTYAILMSTYIRSLLIKDFVVMKMCLCDINIVKVVLISHVCARTKGINNADVNRAGRD